MGNELKNRYGTDEERVSVLEVFYVGMEETETGISIKYESKIAIPEDECESDEDRILDAIFCNSLAESIENTAKHLRERAAELATLPENQE